MKKSFYLLPLWVSLLLYQFSTAQTYCSPAPSAGLFLNSMDFTAAGFTGAKTYSTTGGGYTQTVSITSGTIQRNMQAGIFSSLSNTSTTSSFAAGTVSYKAYADWNRDGDFTDAGENVFDGTNSAAIAAKVGTTNGYATFAIYFAIPVSAQTGNIRMRFALRQSGGPADPCGAYTGEVEDYIITVQGNTAPILDISATPLINPITDGQTNNDGFTITQFLNSTLPSANLVSDPDFLNTVAPFGIAVTGTGVANGQWEYKLPSGIWMAFGAVSNANALLLASDGETRIRFVPTTSGTASFQFKAWDITTGSNGQYANAGTSGGTTAYSTVTRTASINVTGIAAAPTTKIFFVSTLLDNVLAGNIDKPTASVYLPSPLISANANLTNATDMVYEPGQKKIIWAESATTDKIVSANPDGSGVTVLLSSGMSTPNGIAVGGGKIFISDNGNKALYRMNSDGTSFAQISGAAGQLPTPFTLKDIEYYSNSLYFISRPASTGDWKIMKAATDGTSPMELFSTPTQPYGLSVGDDVVYWTEYVSGNSYLKSGTTAGGGGTGTLLLTATGRMYRDLEVDVANNKLYIIDIQGSSAQTYDRSLWTTSLSGTGLAKVLTFGETYSNFALQTPSASILPVRWLSFDAKASRGIVSLNWQTTYEINHDYFLVERSGNGTNFEVIGRVESRSSPEIGTYRFSDNSPLTATAYYRIKQVDVDGTVTYSDVRKINGTAGRATVKVYPNPVTGSVLMVERGSTFEGLLNYQIVNTAGFAVRAGTLQTAVEKIALTGLPSGMYVMLLSNGGSVKFEKK
ncbi:MAG TPA: GEVED domain-containing protein [Flavisolibacter sp.]